MENNTLNKHVVILTSSFPEKDNAGNAAAGLFVKDFALELSQHTHVTVIAPSVTDEEIQTPDYKLITFKVPKLPLTLLSLANPFDWFRIHKTLTDGQRVISDYISRSKIDHILCFWVIPCGYWAYKAFMTFKIPYSVWALGSDITRLGRIPVVRNFLKKIILNSTHCFADGIKLKNDVEILTGKPCSFLCSTRNLLLDGKKILKTSPPYNLCFIGRWHKVKGIDILMEALTLLSDEDWKKINSVRIIGGGPMEAYVHSSCNELRKKNRTVEFTGFLKLEDIRAVYQWADYVLIPSRNESIPVVFSEAMQAGCPIVATPVGDLPRLIKEYKVGCLAENKSAEAFKECIIKLLGSTPFNFLNNINIAAEQFDLKFSVQKFLKKSLNSEIF